MDHSTNPLREVWTLPPFDRIAPEHAQPAMEAALAEARAEVARLEALQAPDFEALVLPLEALHERLQRIFSPIAHLNAVASNPAWREAHDRCLEQLTAFHAEVEQNAVLFRHFQALRASAQWAQLRAVQRKLITDALRDFALAGVHLPAAGRDRVRQIRRRLSVLGARFEANVLEAADHWAHDVDAPEALSGLPKDLIAAARRRAREAGADGFRLGLDGPTFSAVMRHARHRPLRRVFYRAWLTRASDQGGNDGRFDNTAVMEEMLALRFELAQLLGFADYAELSLATKMAPGVARVFEFLEQLVGSVKPRAEAEHRELAQFATQEDGLAQLEPWDLTYYSERLQQQRLGIGEEDLRPYFPLPRVLDGLFDVARRLFGVRVAVRDGVAAWHRDVRYYDVTNAAGERIAGFYLDPYARAGKRSGAWMDVCTSRAHLASGHCLPVAYLTLNAATPQSSAPALMTHEEVITLFHEFGHGLHHMLTRVDLPSLSGIAGVEWDAVELPSQLLENWCWERDALNGFARHYQTGEALPDVLFQRLQRSRTHMSGLHLIRQLEFALFDFHLHADYDPARGARVAETLKAVRERVAVMPVPDWNRFAHGFGHIFGGGYAAGYYSYLWAEVLAADAYDVFREAGVFDARSGARLHGEILAVGGSRPAMESFKAFRGREPRIGPLLTSYGIAA